MKNNKRLTKYEEFLIMYRTNITLGHYECANETRRMLTWMRKPKNYKELNKKYNFS